MSGIYLAALVISIGCLLLIDRRWRLFWWADARAAAITMVAGLVFFLAWDLVGIASGIFFIGSNDLLLGLELVPELPIEEPVFLVLLVQTAMTCYGSARLVLAKGQRR